VWLGGVLALACNQLTGVDDLEFRDGSRSDMMLTPGASCDLLSGGGCGTGQTCRFDAETEERVCRSAPLTSLEPYGLCESDDECPVAHRCLDNICNKVCDSSLDCEGPTALCLDRPESGLGVCTRPCDLVSPQAPRAGLQACGEGARCEFVTNGSYTSCFVAGDSFENGRCRTDRDCPASLLCVSGLCARACDTTGAGCGAGLTCSGIEEYAGQSVGSCCSVPAGHACDLVSNCGCAADETCDRSNGVRNTCRAVPASATAPSGRCDVTTACGAGQTCAGNTCDMLCKTDADCAGVGDVCVDTTDANGNLDPSFRVCSRGCDVFSPLAPGEGFFECGPETVCGLYITDAVTTSVCVGAGAGVEGTRCALDSECSPGLLCAFGRCSRTCEVAGTSCGAGAVCRGTGVAFDDRELGACCTIPAGEACDLVTDCGCAADEACSAGLGEGGACRPLSNTVVESSVACDLSADTCPGGHSCVNGGCARNCRVDADCPGVGSVCSDFLSEPIPERYCSTSCNVLDSTSAEPGFEPCGSGLACTVVITGDDVSSIAFNHCAIPGPVGEGGDCAINPDCATGLQCLDGVCVPSCLVEVDTCSNGRICFETIPLVVVNGYTLGVCDFI
jgi:hypothetical protein